MSGFLAPYRVLDLTDERGLLAGQMLAKLGADVIQVEPPEGSSARRVGPFADDAPAGDNSLFWSAYAAGKRGIRLDLASEAGRAKLAELAMTADFLFESGAQPLDLAALRAANPRLITVSITAFGSTGPKAGYAAADLTLWAAGGPLLPSRDGPGAPLAISVPQSWLHAASDAADAAMIAHFARVASGRGQHVEITAQASVAQATLSHILSEPIGHTGFSLGPASGPKPKKKELDLSGSGSRTRRNKWTVRDGLAELNLGPGPAAGRFTNNLMAWMKAEGALSPEFHGWDWIALPPRILSGEISDEALERVREEVATHLAQFSKQELSALAIKHKLLLAPLMTMADLLASEHNAARQNFVTVEEASGARRTVPGSFVKGVPPVALRPAPALGEYDAEILS